MLVDKHIIPNDFTIKEALYVLNAFEDFGVLTLFVVDENQKLIGTVTDGDIRRGLVNGVRIEQLAVEVMHTKFRFFEEGKVNLESFKFFKEKGLRLIPVVSSEMTLLNLVDITKKRSFLPVDSLIMAGGRGTRLKPLTDTTPKPLLKVGDKPIIEHNIDRLNDFGINNLTISVKYLGEQLEDYFEDGKSKSMSIKYLWEDEPLGTIGVASKLEMPRNEVLLVMNSDLLTNVDFEDMYLEFINSEADMMVASIPYEVNIPYAVLETSDSRIVSLKEKPTYTYYSNAGIYLLKKSVLGRIPQDTHYNATDLLEELIESGNKVSSYPILGYWLDIGKTADFEKAQEDFKHIKL